MVAIGTHGKIGSQFPVKRSSNRVVIANVVERDSDLIHRSILTNHMRPHSVQWVC